MCFEAGQAPHSPETPCLGPSRLNIDSYLPRNSWTRPEIMDDRPLKIVAQRLRSSSTMGASLLPTSPSRRVQRRKDQQHFRVSIHSMNVLSTRIPKILSSAPDLDASIRAFRFSVWSAWLCFPTFVGHNSDPLTERKRLRLTMQAAAVMAKARPRVSWYKCACL